MVRIGLFLFFFTVFFFQACKIEGLIQTSTKEDASSDDSVSENDEKNSDDQDGDENDKDNLNADTSADDEVKIDDQSNDDDRNTGKNNDDEINRDGNRIDQQVRDRLIEAGLSPDELSLDFDPNWRGFFEETVLLSKDEALKILDQIEGEFVVVNETDDPALIPSAESIWPQMDW